MNRIQAVQGQLGWTAALTFLAVGLVNLIALSSPFRMGSPEWELASASEFATTMAPLALGLVGTAGMALLASHRKVAVVLGVALVIVGLCAAFAAAITLTNAPLVWNAVRAGAPPTIKVATAKTVGLLGLYAVGFWVVAGSVINSALRRR